jgi:hypothetical protein
MTAWNLSSAEYVKAIAINTMMSKIANTNGMKRRL